MCIAVVASPGKRISHDWLTGCFNGNRDGSGIAYLKDNKVHIRKGIFKLEDLIAEYDAIFEKYGQDKPMLVHCRIATQGKVNADNCHPFPVKGGALIHNGTFWYGGSHDDEMSDTRMLASELYEQLSHDNLSRIKKKMEQRIGDNKVAVLYNTGETIVLNQKSWYEEDGILFSTQAYKWGVYQRTRQH